MRLACKFLITLPRYIRMNAEQGTVEKPLRTVRRRRTKRFRLSHPDSCTYNPLNGGSRADRTSCMSEVLEIASVHEGALT